MTKREQAFVKFYVIMHWSHCEKVQDDPSKQSLQYNLKASFNFDVIHY